MEWRLLNDKKQWNEFVAGQTHAQFLESYEWGEFQKSFGRRVWRIGGFKNVRQVVAAQVIEHYLGLGCAYFYVPRGPIWNKDESTKPLVDFIKNKIANYGSLFFKVEGQKELTGQDIKRVVSIQPAYTILLDLQKSENEILSGMHQKTRYNIRLAYKKNLDLKITAGENFSEEWRLLRDTGRRDKISLHPRKYYYLMDEILGKDENFDYKKFFVFKDGNHLVVGVFIGFGDTFTYVHGASSNKDRELMAPYLLQWEAIKYAKAQGYKYYDFGGVNPIDKMDFEYRPKREGISRFKYGWGGEIYDFGKTFDVILKPRGYKWFNFFKKIKRLF